jgi:hypothetical protein
MRRAGDSWKRVATFENLLRAAKVAARGKRNQPSVARFLDRVEPESLALLQELEGDLWRPGRPIQFQIHDPKTRTISAAPFRDRVVHHALIDPIERELERRMVSQSFACRRGKGQHAAVKHAQRMMRAYDRFVKMDIRKCFDSIRPCVVMATLDRVIKDRRILTLCERIVRGRGSEGGLPIGNLTSQWFANLVLDRLDHFVKEELRVPGYVRYMDDFVLFHDDAGSLRAAERAVITFLDHDLQLQPKCEATIRAPTHVGLPYLGMTIFKATVRIRPINLRRTRRRFEALKHAMLCGNLDSDRLCEAQRSMLAHLKSANTLELRRRAFVT